MNYVGSVSEKDIDWLFPSMSIDYIIKGYLLRGGDFENVPKDILGAEIYCGFPYVAANCNFLRTGFSYRLYVGKEHDIEELLNTKKDLSQSEKDILLSFLMDGIKSVVYLSNNNISSLEKIRPLRYADKVFATWEEMENAIKKIYNTFKSAKFSVSLEPQDQINL